VSWGRVNFIMHPWTCGFILHGVECERVSE
jgi:hypothetical protein